MKKLILIFGLMALVLQAFPQSKPDTAVSVFAKSDYMEFIRDSTVSVNDSVIGIKYIFVDHKPDTLFSRYVRKDEILAEISRLEYIKGLRKDVLSAQTDYISKNPPPGGQVDRQSLNEMSQKDQELKNIERELKKNRKILKLFEK